MAVAPSLTINLPPAPVERLDSAASVAALRALPSLTVTNGQNIAVDGTSEVGDGGGGLYVWAELSTQTDNGFTVVRPDDVEPNDSGRWILTGSLFDLTPTAGPWSFIAAAGQTQFTATGSEGVVIEIKINGQIVVIGEDYTQTGDVITFTIPLSDGDEVDIVAPSVVTGVSFTASSISTPVPGGTLQNFLESRSREVLVTDFPWFADPTGVTDSTDRIQSAIDYMASTGGGTVAFPDGAYRIGPSSLDETYDNDGVAVPASACGLVQRAGVSLVGLGRRTARIFTDDRTLAIIAQIAPVNCEVSRLEIHSDWETGLSGAGHGILTLGTEGGADISCRSNLYSDLYIHNVGSYCIGLQNGNPTRCTIGNCDTYMNGADSFDLKARGDDGIEPNGNVITDITVRRHGSRVTGSAGVDVRGIWHVSKITVTDFGGNPALDFIGVRIRTKPPVEEDYLLAGARSTVSQVYVKPIPGAAGLVISGVQVGSDDVSISNVVTDDCHYGIIAVGNVNGVPIGSTITGCHALNSRIYGFFIGAGCEDTTLIGCHSQGSATAGIRDEGVRTKIIGHDGMTETVALSTSAGALPTQIVVGGALGVELGLTTTSAAAGRVSISPVGPSTDIDIGLNPKGAGLVRMGTYAASGDVAVNGYITIKDSSGATRKLATVA